MDRLYKEYLSFIKCEYDRHLYDHYENNQLMKELFDNGKIPLAVYENELDKSLQRFQYEINRLKNTAIGRGASAEVVNSIITNK